MNTRVDKNGNSPFSLLFGRNPFSKGNKEMDKERDLDRLIKNWQFVNVQIYPRIQQNEIQNKQKALDQKRIKILKDPNVFNNTFVMKKDLKKNGKMDSRYLGPFLSKKHEKFDYYQLFDKNGILMYNSNASELKKVSIPSTEHLFDSKMDESKTDSEDTTQRSKEQIELKVQDETSFMITGKELENQ